jgi:hypothetical protein
MALEIRVGKNPGFFKKKPTRVVFFGFYWVLLGIFGFIGFFQFSSQKIHIFAYIWPFYGRYRTKG